MPIYQESECVELRCVRQTVVNLSVRPAGGNTVGNQQRVLRTPATTLSHTVTVLTINGGGCRNGGHCTNCDTPDTHTQTYF